MLEQAETTFTVESTVWGTVDRWACNYGYRLVQWEANSRVYEKRHTLLRGYGRWRIEIDQHRPDVEIGASVRFRPLSPPGPGRESFLHRARDEANALLAALQQAPLDSH